MFCEELISKKWKEEDYPVIVDSLRGEMKAAFSQLNCEEFQGYLHDITNLKNLQPHQTDFISRYAKNIKVQILAQGIPDVVECTCSQSKTQGR